MGYILSITKGERPQSFLPQLKLGGTTKEMGWASVNDTPDPTPNNISYFVRRKRFSLSNVIYSTLEPPPPVLPLQWLSNQTTGRKCHHSSSLVNHCWNSNNNNSSNNNTHEKAIDFSSRVTMDFSAPPRVSLQAHDHRCFQENQSSALIPLVGSRLESMCA